MSGAEPYFILAVLAGFAALFTRDHLRRRRQIAAASRRGLAPGPANLAHLPARLQETVLFMIGDGGHEHGVLVGALDIEPSEAGAEDPAAPVPMTVFDFHFQRDVRGEWAYLDTEPPFRVFSPLTVVVFELPDDAPRLLVKRRGKAEKIAEDGWERYRSVADIVRDASAIDRAIAVEVPAGLSRQTVDPAAPMPGYLIWAEQPEHARALFDAALAAQLDAPGVVNRELIIELVGPLMLVYCAKHGPLSARDADAFVDTARALCRAFLRALERTGRPAA